MTLVPRALLLGALAGVVALAILTATAQAAFVFGAPGPVIAAMLGLALFPALIRGASTGELRTRTAWTVAAVGCVICWTATIGLDPARLDSISISWYTCGVLAGAVMVWMAGHRLPPLVAVTCLLLQVSVWAGPLGAVRLGLAAEIVLVIAGLIMHRAVHAATEVASEAAREERESALLEAEQDAHRLERQLRLRLAAQSVAPMLQRIVDGGGRLDTASRAECLLLEQTLRDEIRGRRLLSDPVRRAVLEHRRRGASVHVLDDGGLDDLAPGALTPLLDDLAQRLAPLRSSRIVVRTGQPDSPTAITLVASTPDETAVALGLDDEQIDLWAAIPRPVRIPA